MPLRSSTTAAMMMNAWAWARGAIRGGGGAPRRQIHMVATRATPRPPGAPPLPPHPPTFSTGAPSLSPHLPARVKVVEVGPRDGLQNEKTVVPTPIKVDLIRRLAAAGMPAIEATSFVSAKWVPQMGDATEVMRGVREAGLNDPHDARGPSLSALTPNLKGLEGALEAGVREVAIFGAASDSFSLRNINCNVMDSFERFKPVVELAKARGVRIRGYVSCVLGCPYEGYIAPDAVGFVAQTLYHMGCYEVSLGDTIGVGTPLSTKAMLAAVQAHGVPTSAIAVHFHNTYGSALANVLAALEEGIAVVDASVGGLGGCPYARGASGNVPSEDVVYMLHGMGIETGVDLAALVDVGDWICGVLGKPNQSKAGSARMSNLKALAEVEAKLAAPTLPPTATAAAEAGGVPAGDAAGELAKKAAEAAKKLAAELQTRRIALCWPQPTPR